MLDTLSQLPPIFLAAVLINNLVLVQFLGLCPFLGVSGRIEMAIGMGFATTFVLTLAAACSYFVHTYLLLPLELVFLKTVLFIFIIAVVVQFVELFIKKSSPLLYERLGTFLPLITSNCAVLGVALLNTQRPEANLITSTFFGFSAAVGFSLVLVLFASIRERIQHANVPKVFQGAPISFITAGLMSLAFMGFTGLVKLS